MLNFVCLFFFRESTIFDHVMSSPESTAKTADSGIESLAKRLSEDVNLGSSEGSSPLPPSTGNEQVDQALVFHLVYCELLLEVKHFFWIKLLDNFEKRFECNFLWNIYFILFFNGLKCTYDTLLKCWHGGSLTIWIKLSEFWFTEFRKFWTIKMQRNLCTRQTTKTSRYYWKSYKDFTLLRIGSPCQ